LVCMVCCWAQANALNDGQTGCSDSWGWHSNYAAGDVNIHIWLEGRVMRPVSFFMTTRSGCTNYPSTSHAIFGSVDGVTYVELARSTSSTAPPGLTLAVATTSFFRVFRLTFYRASPRYVDIVETRIAGHSQPRVDRICTASEFEVREDVCVCVCDGD
jgi:hypothetical protein